MVLVSVAEISTSQALELAIQQLDLPSKSILSNKRSHRKISRNTFNACLSTYENSPLLSYIFFLTSIYTADHEGEGKEKKRKIRRETRK